MPNDAIETINYYVDLARQHRASAIAALDSQRKDRLAIARQHFRAGLAELARAKFERNWRRMVAVEAHFHRSDDRFCGSPKLCRRFTLNPDEVTCQACKDRDTFVLSPEGKTYLQGISAAWLRAV